MPKLTQVRPEVEFPAESGLEAPLEEVAEVFVRLALVIEEGFGLECDRKIKRY